MNGDSNELWAAIHSLRSDVNSQRLETELLKKDIGIIAKTCDQIQKSKVSLEKFTPVQALAYGAAGIILTGTISAIVALAMSGS